MGIKESRQEVVDRVVEGLKRINEALADGDSDVLQTEENHRFLVDDAIPLMLADCEVETVEDLELEDVFEWLDDIDAYFDDDLQEPLVDALLDND